VTVRKVNTHKTQRALETGKRNLKVLKGLCAFLPADRGLKRNGGKGRSCDRVVAIVGTR
jgi:hypothetical protein